MKKKKVLIFVPRLLERGGIESHLKELCFQFKGAAYELSILVLDNQSSKETQTCYKAICSNTWFIQANLSILRWLMFFKILPKLWINKFDIFYSNGQGNSILLLNQLFNKKLKWIHHHHTTGDYLDKKAWSNSYFQTLKKCDVLIACTEVSTNSLSGILQREVVHISCFSREIILKNQSHSNSPFRLGYFGRLIKEKGIDLLAQMSTDKDFEDIEFHIWGDGKSYPISYFNSFSNLFYHGSFQGEIELTEVLNYIDALILISTHPEGLPISLLETMGSGKPWIASDIGGIVEISIDSKLNYLLSRDIDYESLKIQVLDFINQVKDRPGLNQNQIQFYKQHYSSSYLNSCWENIFAKI